jgi:hypothetical protein
MHIMKEKLCFAYFINSAFSDAKLNFNQITVFPVYKPIFYHPPLLINVLCVRVHGPLFLIQCIVGGKKLASYPRCNRHNISCY